jgi:hypothetical protein
MGDDIYINVAQRNYVRHLTQLSRR